ncbi:hypothetical protein CFOL_v3_01096 [Cephalotus follicularis]|uniref:Epidermal patterning factor-like protein n=1 Tax=Cephalotus follicularis TaxID=3775 RepID=A0A1Q3APA0_CEPFO|nr:hypothetical protein CFOL_v3_01096 [Cephalotus follicularis]
MGVLRHHYNHHHQSTFTAFIFLLFASASAISLTQLGNRYQEREERDKGSGSRVFDRVLTQKRFSGPGSSPPTCRSKCGRCSPCMPVHVPVQPGLSIPLEYYPEAWRCKCGNKLFMP